MKVELKKTQLKFPPQTKGLKTHRAALSQLFSALEIDTTIPRPQIQVVLHEHSPDSFGYELIPGRERITKAYFGEECLPLTDGHIYRSIPTPSRDALVWASQGDYEAHLK